MDSRIEDDAHSSASSEFFSPISLSFFQPTSNVSADTPNRSLPPLHDTSWIGARLSPIRSFDKETVHDDSSSDSLEGALRKSALLHSQQQPSWSSSHVAAASETTRLIRNHRGPTHTKFPTFHPRYHFDNNDNDETAATTLPPHRIKTQLSSVIIGRSLCILSALELLLVTILSPHNDNDCSNAPSWWWWPIIFSCRLSNTARPNTLALEPAAVLQDYQYWRLATSLVLSTTLLEWACVSACWCLLLLLLLRTSSSKTLIPPWIVVAVYLASAVTGQLWVLALESNNNNSNNNSSSVGCFSWGTAGVLCATGWRLPAVRLPTFVLAAALTVLAWWLQPYNSVYGVLGGAVLGWVVEAADWLPAGSSRGMILVTKTTQSREERIRQWTCGTIAIFLWVAPVIWIALSD